MSASLFRVGGSGLEPLNKSSLVKEEQLEDWLDANPLMLGLDVLIIGRQVITEHGGRIDILAIDRAGDLVILELKRDKTPREIVAQILDYASWVVTLTTPQVHDIALKKLGRRLEDVFLERFETALPDVLNANHSMIVVASEFDASSKRIVEYLAEHHDININTAFFSIFDDGQGQLLATDWLLDQQEVAERSESKTKSPWSGIWYANVGEGPNRSWEDMRTYGFLASGGGRVYSKKLEQLNVGDHLYAYQKQAGYVGHGVVTSAVVPVTEFQVDGSSILSKPLKEPHLAHDKDDPELGEYLVGVNWLKTVPIAEGKTFPKAFANQNIVCKLRDPATIEFLGREFGPVRPQGRKP